MGKKSKTKQRQLANHKKGLPPLKPITVVPKPGLNDPCPCGSGLKYKKCCKRFIS